MRPYSGHTVFILIQSGDDDGKRKEKKRGEFSLLGLKPSATVRLIYRGSEMIMMVKCQFHWWRNLEYSGETLESLESPWSPLDLMFVSCMIRNGTLPP